MSASSPSRRNFIEIIEYNKEYDKCKVTKNLIAKIWKGDEGPCTISPRRGASVITAGRKGYRQSETIKHRCGYAGQ